MQTDESVDIAGDSQLMVSVKYRGEDNILEEFKHALADYLKDSAWLAKLACVTSSRT